MADTWLSVQYRYKDRARGSGQYPAGTCDLGGPPGYMIKRRITSSFI
jgi:hypothetical protein